MRTGGRPAYLATARWLSGSIALLIIWGSLFPFEFIAPDTGLILHRLAHALSDRMSKRDMIANILVYMPFGAVFLLTIDGRSRLAALLQASLAGSLLSLCVELSQLLTPHRVTSALDWTFNTIGSFAGAAVLTLYLMIGSRWRFKSLIGTRPALIPLWLVLIWLVAELAPYYPAFNAARWHAALKALQAPPPYSIVLFSACLAGWLVLAEACRRIWTRRYSTAALSLLIAFTLLGRLWIIGQHLRAEEIAAWAIALAGAIALRDTEAVRRTGIGAAACAAALLIGGLWPPEFAPQPHEFHWIPFSGNLLLSRDYDPLLEKLFLYASLLWTLTLCLGRRGFAFLVAFVLTTAVEILQMWMPGRRAEITDPLLIVALAGLFALAGEFQPYALGCIRKAGGGEYTDGEPKRIQ